MRWYSTWSWVVCTSASSLLPRPLLASGAIFKDGLPLPRRGAHEVDLGAARPAGGQWLAGMRVGWLEGQLRLHGFHGGLLYPGWAAVRTALICASTSGPSQSTTVASHSGGTPIARRRQAPEQ